jgi:hypothetical protein
MQRLRAKLEKLTVDAEDCELIAKLAIDVKSRVFFTKMAVEFRSLATVIEDVIKLQTSFNDNGFDMTESNVAKTAAQDSRTGMSAWKRNT